MSSSQHLTLTDQHTLLLERYIEESRSLREEMAKKEEQSRQILAALNCKIDALNEKVSGQHEVASKKRRKSASNPLVPLKCRGDFRKMYKNLRESPDFNGFDFATGESSSENNQVYARVAEAVFQDYGGEDKCPWSKQLLKGASATYFKSLRDGRRRSTETHKRKCRRQGRMREKLEHRIAALERTEWTETAKTKIKKVLTIEYTSSDESVMSEDEENGGAFVSRYEVKRLPWERSQLTNIKKQLEKTYHLSLTKRVRNATITRTEHATPSSRPPPEDPVQWAVRNSSQRSLMNSVSTSSGESSVHHTPSTDFNSSSQPRLTSTPVRSTPVPRSRARSSPTY